MHSVKKNTVCALGVWIFFLNTCGAFAEVQYDNYLYINQIDNITSVINEFNDKKFSVYLEGVTHYSYEEYQAAINNLCKSYKADYSSLDLCTKEISEEEGEYVGQWHK